MVRRFWERWKRFAHKLGAIQFTIFMFILYVFFAFPFALIVRLFYRQRYNKKSYWLPKHLPDYTIENYREQGTTTH